MNDLWLSIKIWTQRLLLAAVAIYAIFFVLNNSGDKVDFWFWFKHEPAKTTVFLLSAMAFAAGMVVMLLLSTAIRTVKQVRELRSRSRQEKMERELADMKAKAAMLQTKPSAGTGPVENV
jgi:lysylphosphatidylglycerol synthetase-like protein (DUF2156 family)